MVEIKTYEESKPNTEKVFFKVRDGEIVSVVVGNHVVPVGVGYQFYVEKHVAEQIEKCEFYLDGFEPKLRLKEGEELIIPELDENEQRILELEYELERLKRED